MMPRCQTLHNPTNLSVRMFSIRSPFARLRLLGLLVALVVAASGCVYRIEIQQGNFLEPKDVDRVTVGMTRAQVRSLLGTPMVADPFNNSRWDYVYYLKHRRLAKPIQRHFIVFFEDDRVARIEKSESDRENAESA
jgi:outer membrane protein assembly factor BamE